MQTNFLIFSSPKNKFPESTGYSMMFSFLRITQNKFLGVQRGKSNCIKLAPEIHLNSELPQSWQQRGQILSLLEMTEITAAHLPPISPYS